MRKDNHKGPGRMTGHSITTKDDAHSDVMLVSDILAGKYNMHMD